MKHCTLFDKILIQKIFRQQNHGRKDLPLELLKMASCHGSGKESKISRKFKRIKKEQREERQRERREEDER